MADLLLLSQKYKADGQRLLDETGVISILEHFGKVKIVGSFAYDLMVDGDIDIYVIVDKLNRKSAFDCLAELIAKTNVLGYMFYDWVKYRKELFPVGYYLGLKEKVAGYDQQWKIDIWLVDKEVESEKYYEKALRNITLDQKLQILQMKAKNKASTSPILSTEIYDKVLSENISNSTQK